MPWLPIMLFIETAALLFGAWIIFRRRRSERLALELERQSEPKTRRLGEAKKDTQRCEDAARRGDYDELRRLHESGEAWDVKTCAIAAEYGNIKLLRYAHEHGCPWDEDTCRSAVTYAADYGSMNCLRYAHENGCPWDEDTCSSAAKNGHFECLQYAHENGCPWDEETCARAANYGHFECLRYAHENGCPWDEKTSSRASMFEHIECLQYALERGCPRARECQDALRELRDARERFGIGIAMSHHNESGHISASDFLRLYRAFKEPSSRLKTLWRQYAFANVR